jgi:hypothetical protein
MKLTKISEFSGVERTMELPITEVQLQDYLDGDVCIQNFFPQLSADQREFIKTGITKEEWDEQFA